jgi:hypothetical protein
MAVMARNGLLILANDEAQTPRRGGANTEVFPKMAGVTGVACSAWFGSVCVDGSLSAGADRAKSGNGGSLNWDDRSSLRA